MNSNQEKNAVAVPCLFDRTVPEEISAECLLPDYKGAISRLLYVRPAFSEAGHFIGGSKADISGRVRFDALYVNADGLPEAAGCEEQYALSLPVDLNGYDPDAGVTFQVTVQPESVVTRVSAPRRLSVRCRFSVRVRAFAARSLAVALPAGTDGVQMLCDKAEYGRHFAGQGNAEVTGDIPFEGGGEPVVVAARGAVYLPDVTAIADGVRCAGEVIVTLLCRREGEGEEAAFTLQKRLPFEEPVAADGVTTECSAAAEGEVTEIRVDVGDDVLSVTAVVGLAVTATVTDPVVFVRDLFLPGMAADCRTEQTQLPAPGACYNRHFSISAVCREGALPVGAALIDVFGETEISEKTVEGGRTALAGTVTCHALCRTGAEYAAGETDFTFRVFVEGDLSAADVRASVPILRLYEEGGAWRADGEVQLAVTAGGTVTVSRVAGASFKEAPQEKRADLELCYPAPGETLWSVAARYGVSPAALAAENGIAGDDPGDPASLCGVRRLLIPQGDCENASDCI